MIRQEEIILIMFMLSFYTLFPLIFKKAFKEYIRNHLRAWLYTLIFLLNVFPIIGEYTGFKNTLSTSVITIAGINMITWHQNALQKFKEFKKDEQETRAKEYSQL